MVKQVTTYILKANLLWKDGTTSYWKFQVLAETLSKAKRILEAYLSEPKRTGLKYIECVGVKEEASNLIIIDSMHFKDEAFNSLD